MTNLLDPMTCSNAARAMYDTLAKASDGPVAAAFEIARDCIDMGALWPEEIVDVIAGNKPLAEALLDAADMQAEQGEVLMDDDAISDEEREEIARDTRRLVNAMRAGAAALKALAAEAVAEAA